MDKATIDAIVTILNGQMASLKSTQNWERRALVKLRDAIETLR